MEASTKNPVLNHLERLQTYDHSQLLDVVDGLRAQGLSNFLPLPQLIVCGDQSSGKSSVLEAICGVPFPKKDNLCTRFATEVILRRNVDVEDIKAHVSIRPGNDRSETDRQNLTNFSHTLQDVQELPNAIQQAKEAMGLGSQGSNAFSTDVLRLEITGQTMPQLTIVDLPGLIHSETKHQTAQDVELVSELVRGYMAQSRSIILAVVSAKNDHANQIVLQRAREADPTGGRTLGIITKPDTLHTGSGSERSFIDLASNADVVFKLGWHVVRNLDTNDLNNGDHSRDSLEEVFFQQSNWRKLGRLNLGIATLRSRLSEVLFGQITRELPQLMEEIEICKKECQSALQRLGRTRETETDQRMYLAELNQKIHDTCRAGCDGNYDDAFFRETDASSQPIESRRMRAMIQNQCMSFRRRLDSSGSRWQIAEKTELKKGKLTRDDAIDRVVRLLEISRGRELPGTFNPLLISELFHEYSGPWESMSKTFVAEIWQSASQFLDAILRHLTDDTVFESYTRLVIMPAMDKVLAKANKALAVLLEESKRHAVTYNHYFTENVADQRKARTEIIIKQKLKALLADGAVSLDESQIPWLASTLAEESEPDMDRSAAQDIFERMQSYYQVALKRLIDNVPIHIIENVVVQELQAVTRPIDAWTMNRKLVEDIAGESAVMRFHRQQLSEKLQVLIKGETTCKRYAVQTDLTPEDSQTSEPDADGVGSSACSIVEPPLSSSPMLEPQMGDDAGNVDVPAIPITEDTSSSDPWAITSRSTKSKNKKGKVSKAVAEWF